MTVGASYPAFDTYFADQIVADFRKKLGNVIDFGQETPAFRLCGPLRFMFGRRVVAPGLINERWFVTPRTDPVDGGLVATCELEQVCDMPARPSLHSADVKSRRVVIVEPAIAVP